MLELLHDADVFAPESLGRNDVLVGGGRVLALAPSLPAWPREVVVHDLQGKKLVPGFVDAHVHVTGGGGEAGLHTRVPRRFAGELAHAGVTTAVGLLGTDTTTRTMEELVATVLGLRADGLSAWCWTGGYQVPPRTLTGRVRDDLVFVDPILGVGELALSDHRSSQPTLDELLRVAADAHVGGMTSGKAGIVHLHLGDGTRGLDLVGRALDVSELPARVFHPTHVNRNPRLWAQAQAFAARGGWLDVTAFPDDDLDGALSAADAITEWFRAGLPRDRLTCSSDGGGCLPTFDGHGHLVRMGVGRPSTLAATLRELIVRELPWPDALSVFTRNVADLLRLPRKGRIAPGADADLVVLDDDAAVRDVMARGRWWLRDGRPVAHGMFESEYGQGVDR